MKFPHIYKIKQNPRLLRVVRYGSLLLLAAAVLSGCSLLLGAPVPTPLPADYLPTAIALTLQAYPTANTVETQPPDAEPSPTLTSTGGTGAPTAQLTPTMTPRPSATPTPSAPSPTPTRTPRPVKESPTPSPTPGIPNAAIEIRNLGAYSKVISPLHLYTYLKPGAGGLVRIELFGEDGRLLVRNIKKVDFVPKGAWAVMSLDLDYEIAAAAESAVLKISVDDEYGRTVALNSVPLILLSVGDPDIVPPMDVLAPIFIREPTLRTLIQGGKLLVTGEARPGGSNPLIVRLVDENGREVGMRLASVDYPVLGSHGPFAVEVPYNIQEPTRVLLTVTEGGRDYSDPLHIASLEVMLSP